ncbi:MAG TPA: OadG family protein [Bacillota bacterium]|jgi:sodium pump decarboxylase gamma subunit|nr:OadG family protein [Bacillota bacterium]HOL09985.1 OadG family protein [Bacillota bacterium]HPO97734.1 OadG family protein [Bacillota bacterium]
MENLQAGIQLLLVGMTMVFIVLVLLMGLMNAMSVLVTKNLPKTNVAMQKIDNSSGETEEELAAIMAVFATKFPERKNLNIKIKQC